MVPKKQRILRSDTAWNRLRAAGSLAFSDPDVGDRVQATAALHGLSASAGVNLSPALTDALAQALTLSGAGTAGAAENGTVGWAFELDRDRLRLARAFADAATGKISGPVGTYSHLAPDLEAEVLAELGLAVDPVSTQIVQRDRHAAVLAAVAITGGSLERFATEVRNLQHTEIG